MANQDCLFCRIVAGEAGGDIVWEGAEVLAFRDINPQAPTHLLIISKGHIPDLPSVTDEQAPMLAEVVRAVRELAAREEVGEDGYRVVTNVGRDAGQSVAHLHFHLLGGRRMSWPPG
jgi:histidine triad (HIT) family protein